MQPETLHFQNCQHSSQKYICNTLILLPSYRAERLGCINAAWPDHFGHYREAAITQTKHHWWWKMNHVFDGINVLKEHPGPFIFLEEDHFVVEDFLHVFQKLVKIWETETPEAKMITLGNYLKKQDKEGNIVSFYTYGIFAVRFCFIYFWSVFIVHLSASHNCFLSRPSSISCPYCLEILDVYWLLFSLCPG